MIFKSTSCYRRSSCYFIWISPAIGEIKNNYFFFLQHRAGFRKRSFRYRTFFSLKPQAQGRFGRPAAASQKKWDGGKQISVIHIQARGGRTRIFAAQIIKKE